MKDLPEQYERLEVLQVFLQTLAQAPLEQSAFEFGISKTTLTSQTLQQASMGRVRDRVRLGC
jgi:hypothetical protein